MSELPESPDYEWHFTLSPEADRGLGDDSLTEMVRRQIRALLQCVVLTSNGVNVAVTGFRFLNEPDREHDVRVQTVDRNRPES